VEEKTSERISHRLVFSFGLEEISMKGSVYVEKKLIEMEPGAVVVVTTGAQNNLDIFALEVLKAEHKGVI